jgi:hypothetical protein
MAVDAAVALGAGTALALGAALVVLGPLWKGDADPPPSEGTPERGAAGEARAEGVSAVEALREIEFDRATGKLSDDDYAALKTAYTRDALAELRASQGRPAAAPAGAVAAGSAAAGVPAAGADPVEEALRAYRARQAATRGGVRTCPVDGARPEADALFCSACGRYLAGACPVCGAPCDREEQRFCAGCGAGLAAAADAPASAVGA